MGGEAQLLRYQSEPQRLRMLGRTHCVDLTIYRNQTTVGLDDSHQNFDQRAFARAVLAADGANFTRSERKRDIPERLDPGIGLADAADRQYFLQRRSSPCLRPSVAASDRSDQ